MSRVVVFTGGGTGGHVFPGIAVIEKLKALEPSLEVVWIGSNSALERDIVGRFGIRYLTIPSGKLRRYLSLRNFLDLFKILGGIIKSFALLLRLKPPIVFSKGGFVSVPPVVAAGLLGIPVFTHESDFDPGLATKINARFAERVFVAYEESKKFYPAAKQSAVRVSGNPVRREIFNGSAVRGRKLVGADHDGRLLLLVLGGSQGAQQVNDLVEAGLDGLLEDFFVVHQTGKAGFTRSDREGLYRTAFFTEEYPDVLAAADLVVGRAGAGTLWELAAAGKPSILIPLASFSRGDQVRNAHQFKAQGAAFVLEGESVGSAELVERCRRLAHDRTVLVEMGRAAKQLFRVDADGYIADEIVKRIGVEHGDSAS